MRLRRTTTAAALLALGVSLLPGTVFASSTATAPTTLYVNNSTADCSDTGPGSQVTPFCSIQAAADVVAAGQTVDITSGSYSGPVTVSASGTAASPIVFEGDPSGNDPQIGSSTATAPTILIKGAAYVALRDLNVSQPAGPDLGPSVENAVEVEGSDNVTLNGDQFGGGNQSTSAVVYVTGDSSDVTVSRGQIGATLGPGVQVDAGGSGDIVTTNDFYTGGSPAVDVAGTSDTAITSNTLRDACNNAIALTGASTGSSVENNAIDNIHTAGSFGCAAATVPVAGILVDSAAASGTSLDYNVVFPGISEPAYEWAGTPYDTATELDTAVGEGAHDLNTDPQLENGYFSVPSEGSNVLNSANSSAPGELSTDLYNQPRSDDPLDPETGAGTYAYYDRGAYQIQDSFNLNETASAEQAPVGGTVSFTGQYTDAWQETLGVSYNFGDGSPVVTGKATVTHAFSAVGHYQVTVTGTNASGQSQSTYVPVTVVAPAPLTPAVSFEPTPSGYVSADASASTDAWTITDYKWNFGDGTPAQDSEGSPNFGHTYTKAGDYTVTLTETDASGASKTITATAQDEASFFVPYGPVRVLDTRNGTGTGGKVAKVNPNSAVSLQIGGNGTIPSGVIAVALNVTVTNASGSGYVTVYPDGTTLPNVSNLNYVAAQTIPNAVIAPVGADGKIDLYDGGGSAGKIDLIADVTGYFVQFDGGAAPNGYSAMAPQRLLDTRNGTGIGGKPAKVAPNNPLVLNISGTNGPLANPAGVAAVALNVTVTNTSGSGNITVFPDGSTMPNTSNLNYAPNKTIANTVIVPVGQDGEIDLENNGASAGNVDLIADVTGYFSIDSYGVYLPVTPTRLLDTRTTLALGPNKVAVLNPAAKDSAVPSNAYGYVFNATVTQPTGSGYIEEYPDGTTAPGTSNVNFTTGETIPNVVMAMPGTDGSVDFLNGGATVGKTQLIVDVFGYFLQES